VITVSDLEEHIRRMGPSAQRRYVQPGQRRTLRDRRMQNQLLAAEALKQGLDRDPEVVRMVEQALVSQLLKREIDARSRPADVSPAAVDDCRLHSPSQGVDRCDAPAAEARRGDRAREDGEGSCHRPTGREATRLRAPSTDRRYGRPWWPDCVNGYRRASRRGVRRATARHVPGEDRRREPEGKARRETGRAVAFRRPGGSQPCAGACCSTSGRQRDRAARPR